MRKRNSFTPTIGISMIFCQKIWLPTLAYELKPLFYIVIASVFLLLHQEQVGAQLAFLLVSTWGLMILFIRRAFRTNGGSLPLQSAEDEHRHSQLMV
jgi:hypothetical protein